MSSAAVPPPPPKRGMGMDHDLQPASYAIVNILFVIGTISILLRCYSRASIVRQFGWDDWIMAAILVFNVGQQAILMLFLEYGAGLHIEGVIAKTPEKLLLLPKLLFTEEIYYVFMQFIIKTCILVFYLRLSPVKSFRIAVFATLAFNAVCTLVIWLVYCLQCRPLQAFWDPTIKGDCFPALFLYFFPASLNITTDVIIFILPFPTLLTLKTSLRRRLVILGIMSFGGIALVVSCLRLIVLYRFAKDPDFTYLLGQMVIISAAEIQTMIIAANIPSFKALWVQGLEFKVFWGSSRSRDTNKGPSNNYELSRGSNQQRVSKQRKEPGIDTELGLRDGSSQEELCAISTNSGDRGRIQVTTDVVVSSDRGTTSESEEMVLEQKRAYYDVGRDVHAK